MKMRTYTGKRVDPLDLQPEDIDIRDIAHSLSQQCRFGGHTRHHYSVAQHSVLVSRYCLPEDALWGLLHDASEAYVVDLPRPVKHADELAAYREIERRAMGVICDRFGLPRETPWSVKQTDDILCATEQRDLMGYTSTRDVQPLSQYIYPHQSTTAEMMFLDRFDVLGGRR